MSNKQVALGLLSELIQYMRLFNRFIQSNKLFEDILTISEMMCDKSSPTHQSIEQINKFRSEMSGLVYDIIINDKFLQTVISYLVDVSSIINYSIDINVLSTVNVYITDNIKQVRQFGTNQMTIANNIHSIMFNECKNNEQKYRNIQMLVDQLQNLRLIMSRFEHDNIKAFLIYIKDDLKYVVKYLCNSEQDLEMQYDNKILTTAIDNLTKIISNKLGYDCNTLLLIKEMYVDIKLIVEKYKRQIDLLSIYVKTESDDDSYDSEYDNN